MRGIAFALAALSFAATTPDPAAAQCYGPECDFRQSNGPGYERPNSQSYPGNGQRYRSVPYEQGQPYRSAPYEQGQSYRQAPNQGPSYRSSPYEQAQPHQPSQYQGQPYQPSYQGQSNQPSQYQGQPYQSAPHQQGQPYQQTPPSRHSYQRPAYQTQPRPPVGYSNVPPGMGPGAAQRGPEYHRAYPNGRMDVQTRVTRISKPTIVRQQHASINRTVVKSAPRTAGSGQITISVTEYRDLQKQARELQRLRSARSDAPGPGFGAGPGAVNGAPPNGPSPFPLVPPAPPAVTPER